jgi:GNAT superfamily N-acetyltransferase
VRYGPSFRETRTLENGTRVTLRCILPSDKDEVRRQFRRLSPDSRYRRFFTGISDLSDQMLRHLTEVDGHDHFALIALVESLDLKTEDGAGVARFVRLEGDPEVAEAAVTVVDDMQQKGLGRVLLEALAEAAKERGIKSFRGEVLTSNSAMRHILESSGATAHDTGTDTIAFDVPLESTDAQSSLGSAFREAARSMQVWLRHLYPPSLPPHKPDEPE